MWDHKRMMDFQLNKLLIFLGKIVKNCQDNPCIVIIANT